MAISVKLDISDWVGSSVDTGQSDHNLYPYAKEGSRLQADYIAYYPRGDEERFDTDPFWVIDVSDVIESKPPDERGKAT